MFTYSFDLFLVRECTDSSICFMFDCGCTFDFLEKRGQFQAKLKNDYDKIK